MDGAKDITTLEADLVRLYMELTGASESAARGVLIHLSSASAARSTGPILSPLTTAIDHQSTNPSIHPFPDLAGYRWRLRDLLGSAEYVREGDKLTWKGLSGYERLAIPRV